MFFIERGSLAPPETLQEMVFTQVDIWLARLSSGNGCERNIAAGGFLNLMKYLMVTYILYIYIYMNKFKELFARLSYFRML
jgi:hypothetical protein